MFSGGIQQRALLANSLVLQTCKAEEAESLLATSAIPYRSELVSRSSTFATQIFSLRGNTILLSRVRTNGAMRVHSQVPNDSYALVLAISGELEHAAGASAIVPVRPGCGFVGSPAQQVEVKTPETFDVFFVRFSAERVAAELEKLLFRQISVPVVFYPRFELSSEAGQRYRRSLMNLCSQLESSGRRPGNGTEVLEIEKNLITLLLEGQRHNYTRLLVRVHSADPWQVRAAEEYIRANLHLPISLGDICLAAGVNSRTLQHSFRRKRGYTPMEFLRKLRLERVHDELCRMEQNVTVTDVALNCGFSHLGRFAGEYRAYFGERPSETLSRARRQK